MSTETPSSSSKRQKTSKDNETSPPYELIYWPSIPGRGEHIRLVLEDAGVLYTDTAHAKDGMKSVTAQISPSNLGDSLNPPPLAPPILKHGDLTISQTSNILLYLGPRLGLMPEGDGMFRVNALVLTALDGLSNEAHDCHHPVSTSSYYEDQLEESKRKSKDYRENRLPKFLGYFERVLRGEASAGGEWLHGGKCSVADICLFHCLDGVKFAFPRAMGRLEKEGKYKGVFELYGRVKGRERIKAYLESERRQEFSLGIYRHYPELDEE